MSQSPLPSVPPLPVLGKRAGRTSAIRFWGADRAAATSEEAAGDELPPPPPPPPLAAVVDATVTGGMPTMLTPGGGGTTTGAAVRVTVAEALAETGVPLL